VKIVKIKNPISCGPFVKSTAFKKINKQIEKAIISVQWPPNSKSFTIHDEPGKKRNQGNGVKPIKDACMTYLKSKGWAMETPVNIASRVRPGPMDATLPVGKQLFCVEWETGNISSSHRALNKMAIGLMNKILIGGVLILPTRSLYKYLTDRVGNFSEIEPYCSLWESVKIKNGYLAIIAVEHDNASKKVPRIPKGTDGRALL
jgi:hypothetical protein